MAFFESLWEVRFGVHTQPSLDFIDRVNLNFECGD